MTTGTFKRTEEIVISLRLVRVAPESWSDAARRYARAVNLEEEVMEAIEAGIASGDSEAAAALAACYEWDLLA